MRSASHLPKLSHLKASIIHNVRIANPSDVYCRNMPPRLGEFPPSPDVPPRTIFASSSAEDVKLWVYHFIIRNQPYMSHEEAWLLAREVKGVGEYALQYDKAQWENEVPGWGALIYLALHETPKYVVSKNQNV